MKIAWFSPRVPEHSEIAKNTERLEAELKRRFEVRFFAEQPSGFREPAADRHFHATMGHTPTELVLALNETDLPIYNIGNNPAFFAKTWFLSQRKPGIVILHDLKLHHFFEGIYRERLGDEGQYLAFMEEYHGAPGLEAGQLYWKQQIFIDFMAENFPMTAWGVRNALAVVVHTQPTLEAVERETGLPALLNALPYIAQALPGLASPAQEATGAAGPFSPEHPVRVAIFGYLNVNRRVIEFFHALATMEERACFEVHLYGTLLQRYEDDVKRDVAALGLQDHVLFHGYVTETELDAGLAGCDLAVNLRFPTMGEASASQLRIWNHALPSLVTRIDGYAAMPEDAVSFVRPDHEREDIQKHLRDFLAQPEVHRRKGGRGRQILLEQHQPATYVERLAALCQHVSTLRSRNVRVGMADRVGHAISVWSHLAPNTGMEQSYGDRIAAMF